ncbi:MAG: HAD-IA family hydrolase [Acidiferrobacterales bacterium]|nr:HAD-IA family hydrolase [Acidiferrobacterales bacterium]
MQLKALLLDLDGTLVDTAPDMVATLNRILANHGQQPTDYEKARQLVSNGARALLEFGFGADKMTSIGTSSLIDEFLADYANNVCDRSKVYQGLMEVLALCEENQIRWGVVTNKPLQLARGVLGGLGILARSSILLGGDSLPVKKPDPAPLLHCCMTMHLAASECLYVGDHERDIIAGKAAGMDTAAALWGYIQPDDEPLKWGANYLLNQPTSLLNLIQDKIVTRNNAT